MTDMLLLGLNGHKLSPSEQAAIECNVPILSQNYKGEVVFWGKVLGLEGDYLLLRVTGEDFLANPTMLFSSDGGISWHMLDVPTDEQREYCDQLRGLFTGNPQHEYKIIKELPPLPEEEVEKPPVEEAEEEDENEGEGDDEGDEEEPVEEEEDKGDGGGEEEEGDGEEKDEKKPAKARPRTQTICIKEMTRLADFAEQANFHCQVVPRGSLLLDEHGNTTVNRTFLGLNATEAGKLASYFHCRRPVERKVEDPSLENESGDPNVDFLDPIVHDIPKGVWVMKFDATLRVVVASNLLYEGMTFYHKPDTPQYGQYYFGYGERNLDLCFML